MDKNDGWMTTIRKDEEIRIERLADQPVDPVSRMHLIAGVDSIFWATTARTITDQQQRKAFRNLWLGDYLDHDPQHVWLALTESDHVAGYLVGTTSNPVGNPRFEALTYFTAFASSVSDYPAHLHINLDEAYRNRRIGRRLIDAFAAQVAAAGLPGLHVVTSAAARNVRFYAHAGFTEIARTPWKSGELVFLGRKA